MTTVPNCHFKSFFLQVNFFGDDVSKESLQARICEREHATNTEEESDKRRRRAERSLILDAIAIRLSLFRIR